MAVLAAAVLSFAGTSKSTPRAKVPSAPWLQAVPAERRATLLDGLKKLVDAEKRQDWSSVYNLRPLLDRETEDEPHFVQRWPQVSPGHILDFEPVKTSFSEFGGLSDEDQVFDIIGCAQVKSGDKRIAQEGGITAHYDGQEWYLDGVHLMTTEVGDPEPCTFHAGHGLLAVAKPQR